MLVLLALRGLAPQLIEHHPQPLVNLLGALIDRPLVAEHLQLVWTEWTPELILHGLRLSDPRGELRVGRLAIRPAGDFIAPGGPRLEGRFVDLSALSIGPGVSVSGLNGEFRVDRQGGTLYLIDSAPVIDAPQFNGNLRPDRTSGVLRWQRQSDGDWHIEPLLSLADTDLRLALDGSVLWRSGHEPELDLQAGFQVNDVSRIPSYLPRSALKPKLVAWLDQALVGGRIPQGRMVLRGAAGDFPFDTAPGEFAIGFRVADMHLRFSPDWPPIEQLRAVVRFRERGFRVDAAEGRLLGAELHGVEASIASLEQAVLTIDGKGRGELAELQRIVEASPLRDRLLPYLESIRLEGGSELTMALEIPLKNRSAPRPVRGELRLAQARLGLQPGDVTLEDVDGLLRFDQNGLREGDLSALLRGQPLALTLGGSETLALRAEGQGRLSPAELLGDGVMTPYVTGRSDWRIGLSVPRNDATADFRFRLGLSSDLRGTAVRLPGGLAKSAETTRPVELELAWLRQRAAGLRLHYGEHLDAEFELNPAGRPTAIHARLAELVLGDYRLGPFELRGRWQPDRYTLRFTGSELAGQLVWPLQPASDQTVWLALDRLALYRQTERGNAFALPLSIEPRRLPPLTLSIAELSLDEHALGQLTLYAEPDASGYALRDLRLDGAGHRLQLQGAWHDGPEGRTTRMQLALTGRDLQHSLDDIGLPLPIELDQGQLGLELNWPDAPTSPDPSLMSGELELALGEGRITGLEPGIGRLLGLANLDSLARRLQLDFSDLAETGFAFDRIVGRARLAGGEARVDRLTVVGPAAQLNLSGRVGLIRHDLDLEAELIPELGSSLALAGALAGGPVIGAAVLLAHQVLEPGLDRLVQLRYTISGPWQSPRVERLDAPIDSSTAGVGGRNRK
jgi:uncharacterized protein YhdP